MRVWTDVSGKFKVEAEYINLVNGNIILHKTNGCKISVPLSRMCQSDLKFLNINPPIASKDAEYTAKQSKTSALSNATYVPVQANPLKPLSIKLEETMLQTLANRQATTYQGFSWSEFLERAGLTSADASKYARLFVKKKIDKTMIENMKDANFLKNLGVDADGDYIRIARYASSFDKPGDVCSSFEQNVVFKQDPSSNVFKKQSWVVEPILHPQLAEQKSFTNPDPKNNTSFENDHRRNSRFSHHEVLRENNEEELLKRQKEQLIQQTLLLSTLR